MGRRWRTFYVCVKSISVHLAIRNPPAKMWFCMLATSFLCGTMRNSWSSASPAEFMLAESWMFVNSQVDVHILIAIFHNKGGKLVGKTDRKAADRQYFILEMHTIVCAGVLSARLLDRHREPPRCFDIQLASVMLGIGATLSPEEVRLALSTADEKVSVSESSSEGTGDRDLDTNRAGSVGSVRKRKRAGSPVKGGKASKVKAGQNAPAASKVTAANS
jgi:hypothetical protein